tara:strand:- start:21 stop:248 length:228 start_codon:yes stop_codon:yes gene_type:complete
LELQENLQEVNFILLAVAAVEQIQNQEKELVVLVVAAMENTLELEQQEQLTLAVVVEDHNQVLLVQDLVAQVDLV